MSSEPACPGELTLHFDPRGALLEATRACEALVFEHWYGNTRAELDREYAPYEDDCTFVAVTDERGDVVAQARLIVPGEAGLKTLHDIARAPWGMDAERVVRALQMDLDRTWDVTTVGVLPRGRSSNGARLALYHGIMQAMVVNEVAWGVAVLDRRVRTLLAWAGFDFPVVPGAAPAPYLGSRSSVPVGVDVPAMLARQQRTNPEAHRLITRGLGLEGVLVPPREHFRLDRAHTGQVAVA